MSKDRGYLRTLSCSISLSSCRVRAEALARSLNSRLWSRQGLDASFNKDTCERLLADSSVNSSMANIVDKPPRNQEVGFAGSDLKEISHCWVNEMAVEDDELFDTPPCSSPPSPADEEIILNPPSPLPFCTKFLRDFNSSAEYRAGGCRDRHAVYPNEAALRDKLQQYADGLLASDEGTETFYDASDGVKKNEPNDFVKKCSPDSGNELIETDENELSEKPDESLVVENGTLEPHVPVTEYHRESHIDSLESDVEHETETSASDNSSSCDVPIVHVEERVDSSTKASFDDSVQYQNCKVLVTNHYLNNVLEEDGRPRLFRSTSLKTGKTPPGTPGRKKIVRFADVLGLDLEAVRHIVSEDLPNVPSSAFSDLKLSPEETAEQLAEEAISQSQTQSVNVPTNTWKSDPTASVLNNLFPLFRPPGTDHDFLDRVRREFVCLEAITVSVHSVHVVCRVLNIAYEKSVTCHYTVDNWRTVDELIASYVPFSSDGEFDRFSFSLFLPTGSSPKDDISFAIKYTVHDKDYWDNNSGLNYTLRYHNNGPLLDPDAENHTPWLHHFF